MYSEKYLDKAIEIANNNVDRGGGPFGALIVKDGEVIAEAGNEVTLSNDPTAHAEILAIRKASASLQSFDLSGCELYTSCEPCPMCLGAIYWANIDAVFYSATHLDAMNAGFDDTDIFKEIKLPEEERSIFMKQYQSGKGTNAFKKWMEKPDKTEY